MEMKGVRWKGREERKRNKKRARMSKKTKEKERFDTRYNARWISDMNRQAQRTSTEWQGLGTERREGVDV